MKIENRKKNRFSKFENLIFFRLSMFDFFSKKYFLNIHFLQDEKIFFTRVFFNALVYSSTI